MRIKIVGNSLSALAVTASLIRSSVPVSEDLPDYTIEFIETDKVIPVVDGIDCEFERTIVNSLANVGNTDIYLARKGGVESDNKLIIGIPRFAEASELKLYEKAVIQGVLRFIHFNKPKDEAKYVPDKVDGFWVFLYKRWFT